MRGNLVVARKRGEAIEIGDDITVTVVRINENQVRLMVSAGKSVSIRRSELKPIAIGAMDPIEVGAVIEVLGSSLPIVGTTDATN